VEAKVEVSLPLKYPLLDKSPAAPPTENVVKGVSVPTPTLPLELTVSKVVVAPDVEDATTKKGRRELFVLNWPWTESLAQGEEVPIPT
jgi:hypothetical protein